MGFAPLARILITGWWATKLSAFQDFCQSIGYDGLAIAMLWWCCPSHNAD
ncbi:MAG: hypothetical protein KME27_18085 [Lyngbya sp. HA4199-MV5]|nr:hypothetical protein [Lyngbya sp. HA4199-MV5]